MEEALKRYKVKDREYVQEGEQIVSSEKCLYTDSLYSCVAIYAMSEKDSYLAHVIVEDCQLEFTFGRCNKLGELYDYIADRNDKMYVGLVYGVSMDECLVDRYNAIKYDFEEAIEKLQESGKNIEILEEETSEYVILDNKRKEIIYEYGTEELKGTWQKKKSQR